jgi:hypothetical protein
VLPDFAGCQRPATWSLLFLYAHPKIYSEDFQCLGMYVTQFSVLFYFKKLSLYQNIWRGMVDVMNRKGFGRWCGLFAESVHIKSRNHETFCPHYVSAMIQNTYLLNIILVCFQLNKIETFLGAFTKMRKEIIRFLCMSVLAQGTNRLPLDGFLFNFL